MEGCILPSKVEVDQMLFEVSGHRLADAKTVEVFLSVISNSAMNSEIVGRGHLDKIKVRCRPVVSHLSPRSYLQGSDAIGKLVN